jgi:hypothetical protein
MQQLFLAPRNIFGVEQAVISILAGDIFGTPGIGWRFALFKLIYRLHRLGLVPVGSGARPAEQTEKELEPMLSR